MIVGETVIVERHVEVGRDGGNNPIFEWVAESVDDVLVAPGPRNDIEEANRPHGTEVRFSLHFPKGYPATLRGARISVRGEEPLDVIGNPQHFTEANTPGRWSMPCEIGRTDG